MPRFIRSHLLVNGRTEAFPYTSVQSGRSPVLPRIIVDRADHADRLRQELRQAVADFDPTEEARFVYVHFTSAPDFLLDLDKLSDRAGNLRLASYLEEQVVDDEGREHTLVHAAVYLNKRAVSLFLRKVDQYAQENTRRGNPKHQSLIANIDQIRVATLQSFWQEPELPFPPLDEERWWEVWLNRQGQDNVAGWRDRLAEQYTEQGLQIGTRQLLFPEHLVLLVKGSAQVLSATLLYSDQLSELRQPKETADFFTGLERQEEPGWIEDLRSRVIDHSGDQRLSICLLDTGINRAHPLLAPLVAEDDLDTVNPAWTTADTTRHGHGTPMAGLTFYGDLTDALASTDPIVVYHRLESIKLIERGRPHDPELYGSVTIEGVARGVLKYPRHSRIVCMAVTLEDGHHQGRPSSWSSAVDQILYQATGEREGNTLFLVASGNTGPEQRLYAPLINDDCSIHDPAQAFNALTVGAYTLKDRIDLQRFPGASLLARRGGMAPCNTTSVRWDKQWCRKPDIVMEGGNAADWQGAAIDPDSLLLLSTGLGGVGHPAFTVFGDTSAATALAARFAAELYAQYPRYWPETIRALMVHSADWTPVMLGNRRVEQLTSEEQKQLLSRVGYGVPSMQRARYSANNSLTLIAERELRPYRLDGSAVKTNEFHLFDLPWPVDVLQELFNTEVRLTITLSYYIEPNPGNRQYAKAASYRSCGLRFKMIDRGESLPAFKARISKTMRDGEYVREGGEDWVLGSSVRDKGSLHKDIWVGPAVELAVKNKIAVYPVNGWWRTLKAQRRYADAVRYSLVVTIEGPDTDIDIYTPVENLVSIQV